MTAKDLFGLEMKEAKEDTRQEFDVRSYRMQGNYGATKFIKP